MYGSPAIAVEFDDRVLAHLRVVITAKIRRNESLAFSWEYDGPRGAGHSTIWLHPAIPLRFDFHGRQIPELSRAWLEELALLANTPAGLRIVPEPTPPTIA